MLERLRNSFWILPAAGIAVAMGAALLLAPLDDAVELPGAVSFTGSLETATTVLQMIGTVAMSVAGISFSVIVVALVLASQQLSPRVLRSFQRNPLNQAVLGLFLGTAAFSLFVLGSLGDGDDAVPELSVTVAMLMAALSLGAFVVFLHHIVRSLNASAVIRRIAAEGHQAVDAPYPQPAGSAAEDEQQAEELAREIVESSLSKEVSAPRAGYVASIDAAALLDAADACDGFVEQRRAIGEFTVTGALLAVVWCQQDRLDELAARVEQAFVLNEERLVDDDVAFPLRQLADVALKGLSPGINDPSTAENAMDSVTDTLVRLARQPQPVMMRTGDGGKPRFRATTPSLDALVRLGFEQVRRDGAARPSFSVRLLELLAELREAGGERAVACDEIARQALAIRDHAVALAEIPTDAELVRRTYERLHGPSSGDGIDATEHGLAAVRGP